MKKLLCICFLMGCAQESPFIIPEGAGCANAQLDHLVGESVWRLSEHPHQNFTIVANGDDWSPSGETSETVVFLDANERIHSFGCDI